MAATGYHCQVKPPLSRKAGQSVMAKAAYNAREGLTDERGELKDYTQGHSEVLFSAIFAPKEAPDWARDRQALWSEVERVESRKNSQLAREVEVSFPHQLDEQQREWLIKDFVRENFTRRGLVADVNIHAPDREGDERNYHAHILLPLRPIDADGFGKKLRFERADWWNERDEQLAAMKEDWAEKCGRMLERAGFEVEAERWRLGHKTLPEQRDAALERGDAEFAMACDRRPGIHLGPHAAAMEEKGIKTERGNELRAIEAANDYDAYLAESKWQESIVDAAITKERHNRSFTDDKAAAPAMLESPKELSATQGDIRTAYAISDSPSAFVAALAERNLVLAEATVYDVQASREAAARAEDIGTYAPVYRKGEIVAVNEYGFAYRLGELTTGDTRKEVEGFLAGVDRAQLVGVGETQAAAIYAREERDVSREMELSTAKAEIRMVYRACETPEQLRNELAERGFWLARATEHDAADFAIDASHLKTRIGYAPALEEREVVAINTFGHIYAFNRATTGDGPRKVQEFMETLPALPDIASTLEEFRTEYQHERPVDPSTGLAVPIEKAAERLSIELAGEAGIREGIGHAKGMVRGADQLISMAAKPLSEVVEKVAQIAEEIGSAALESIGSMFDAPKVPTIEERMARLAARAQADAQRAEQTTQRIREMRAERDDDQKRIEERDEHIRRQHRDR